MRPVWLLTTLFLLPLGHAWADGADGSGDPAVFDLERGLRGGTTVGLGESGDGETGALDLAALREANAPRLKDIGKLGGLRINQLYGIGLVTGLAATGDDLGNSRFTAQMVANYLNREGVLADPLTLKSKNFAAVTLTAELGPFVQVGDTLDVTISAMGTAVSLEGGQLIMSPLKAASGEVYAIAQGPITLGGFGATSGRGGARAGVQKNFLTVGRIPNGAILERPVANDLPAADRFTWTLKEPDFTTAQRAAAALNLALPGTDAVAVDAQQIALSYPASFPGSLIDFLAQVEQVQVRTDMPARIVINERNGTIVVGSQVRIKPVTVAHGGLTVSVVEGFAVSQPDTPFTEGGTAVTPEASVTAEESEASLIEATTVQDLLQAVERVGGSVRDAVSILQALKAAGALDAELVVI